MQIASILMEIRFFFSSNAMGSKVVQNSYSGLTRLMTMFGTQSHRVLLVAKQHSFFAGKPLADPDIGMQPLLLSSGLYSKGD